MFSSTKKINGFSTCFRQEKSAPIHCSKLHGYSIEFEVEFEGELDDRNWVVDFGFMKRSKNKIRRELNEFTVDEWFKYMFDHTVIVAYDDTQLEWFKSADQAQVLNLRVLPAVGCERFAEYVYNTLSTFLIGEFGDRMRVKKVTCRENINNSASYYEN